MKKALVLKKPYNGKDKIDIITKEENLKTFKFVDKKGNEQTRACLMVEIIVPEKFVKTLPNGKGCVAVTLDAEKPLGSVIAYAKQKEEFASKEKGKKR